MSILANPIFRSVDTRLASGSAASLTPTLPAVDGAFGILICEVQSKNNAVHSCATVGWSKLPQQNSGGSFTSSIFYAAEGVAAPTITWVGSTACAAQMFYYADPQNTTDSTPGATSVSFGNTSPHTSAAVATTRDNSLVIYIDACATSGALAAPAGWTEDVDNGSATDNGQTTTGSKPITTSGTSSGAISVAGSAAAWVQWQIEIRSSATGAALESSLFDPVLLAEPPNGLDSSQFDPFAGLIPPDGLDSSQFDPFLLIRRTTFLARVIEY